jgi:hypothetical protein
MMATYTNIFTDRAAAFNHLDAAREPEPVGLAKLTI